MQGKFYLDVHDFGFLLPGLDDILRLKAIYPNFKITCFTIPMSELFFAPENHKHFKVEKYKKWAKIINSYDWMEIGLHGFSHSKHEMDVDYPKAMKTIQAAENLFQQVGLSYKRIFVAPYWQISWDALIALKDLDYIVGVNRDHPRPVPEGLKTFEYNWSFEEPLPDAEKIFGHGHLTGRGVKNAIYQAYPNIIKKIPKDAEFGFISELYEKNHQKSAAEGGAEG